MNCLELYKYPNSLVNQITFERVAVKMTDMAGGGDSSEHNSNECNTLETHTVPTLLKRSKTATILVTYTGEELPVCGTLQVDVEYGPNYR